MANTLLSDDAFSAGEGSFLEVMESSEGVGSLEGRAAEVGGGEGSGSSSSASDSLEAEPDSSKKLRVFLKGASSSHVFPELQNDTITERREVIIIPG